MLNYTLPKYDNYRKWIRDAREHEIQWKDIEYANKGNEEGLNKFLETQNEINWWELINLIEWKEIVVQEKKAEEQTKEAEFMEGSSMILDENQDNAVTVPKDKKSA